MKQQGQTLYFMFSLMSLLLFGGPCQAQDNRSETRSEVDLRIAFPSTSTAGSSNSVVITVAPKKDFPKSLLKVVTGGILFLEKTTAYENDTPSEPYFPSLPANFLVRGQFGKLTSGTTIRETLAVRAQGTGFGYLTAMVVGLDEHGHSQPQGSLTYYAFSDGRALYVSDAGFLDAEVRLIRASGGSRTAIEQQLKQIFRSSARSTAAGGAELYSSNAPKNTASVNGRIMFMDRRGHEHPVRFVELDVMEAKNGAETVLSSGVTDDDGRYAIIFPMSAGAGKDIFVVVKASGPTVRVTLADTNHTWSIASSTVKVARSGAAVNLDLTATNLLENNTAFEVYEAVNYASQFVATLSGSKPDFIRVHFPDPRSGNPDGSQTRKGHMHLAGTDAHDWDDIHHEYGHHVQAQYGLANSPAGSHSPSQNLCTHAGSNKDKGIRLAWGEGWPTFFGILLQRELGLKKLDIPTVGDANYTDTNPAGTKLNYSLESAGSNKEVGEGNENAVSRALWGLYARRSDVSELATLSAKELWSSFLAGKHYHFSAWWQTVVAGKSIKTLGQYGAVLATQGLASSPLAPVNEALLSANGDVEFKWKAVKQCADAGKDQYSLRIYGSDLMAPAFSSPFTNATDLTLTAAQVKTLAGANSRLFWAVVSRDDTEPATGEFHGPLSAINLRSD